MAKPTVREVFEVLAFLRTADPDCALIWEAYSSGKLAVFFESMARRLDSTTNPQNPVYSITGNLHPR